MIQLESDMFDTGLCQCNYITNTINSEVGSIKNHYFKTMNKYSKNYIEFLTEFRLLKD